MTQAVSLTKDDGSVEDDDERGIVQLSIRISEALSDHPNGLSLDHRRCCAVTGDFVLHIKPG